VDRTDGLTRIARYEGIPGLWRGTVMAVVGVSNGAIQFMAYEELKKWGRERKMQRGVGESEAVDLVSPLSSQL
jgi:solute carrier family 25 folate transporter 32